MKNKLAAPFREATYESRHGTGIDKVSSLLDAAVQFEVVEKAGAWFKYNGENLGQGKDAVKDVIKADPKLLKEIWNKVKEKAGL